MKKICSILRDTVPHEIDLTAVGLGRDHPPLWYLNKPERSNNIIQYDIRFWKKTIIILNIFVNVCS